jgi:hypothetical protein
MVSTFDTVATRRPLFDLLSDYERISPYNRIVCSQLAGCLRQGRTDADFGCGVQGRPDFA